ncbi:TetR/AcrR family transcriptional regulator [Enterococcus sp. LJL120]
MPTNTFFGLPQEKQQRLLDAAKIEFSRASLNEASISNIIKLAEIPRGSFYQYFENKEDLYYYYFDQLRHDTRQELHKSIQAADGDLLEGIKSYSSKMIYEILTGENSAFFKNLFMNMDYRFSRRMTAQMDDDEKAEKRRHQRHQEDYSLWDSIDQSQLKIDNQEDFRMLLHMLMTQMFIMIATGYRMQQSDPDFQVTDLIKKFQTQINWVRDGIYLQKEGE